MREDYDICTFSIQELENIALLKRFFEEVWNNGRTELIQKILSDNLIAHYEHDETKDVKSWKERFYDVLVKAIGDLHITIEAISAKDDIVFVQLVLRGVHKSELFGVSPSGKWIEVTGMSWNKIANGKVIEKWNNWNMGNLFRQLIKDVTTLQGLLPMCSFCKSIRDEKGCWEHVDTFLTKYSEADISHGVCPECMEKNYPDV